MQLRGGRYPQLRWGERVPLRDAEPGGVRIDLSDLKFAEPTLALRLGASSKVHEEARVPFEIVAPSRAAVRSYLARTGLAEAMELEPCECGPDVLIPITRIEKPQEVDPLGEELQSLLKDEPTEVASVSGAVMSAFSELCDNACTHGRSKHGMFLLVQRFGSRLVLAVGDLGIGIPQHLSDAKPELAKLDHAKLIAEALQPGVTATHKPKRGKGLPDLIEAIRNAENAGSELRIWSGEGRVILRYPRNRREVRVVGASTPGTWAEVVLSPGNRSLARARDGVTTGV
jgi:hypothetical protein